MNVLTGVLNLEYTVLRHREITMSPLCGLFLAICINLSPYLDNQDGFVMARLYTYNPELGGHNCDYECSRLGNGALVSEWWGRACACPLDFPRGTRFVIRGSRWGLADGTWICLDGGGAVVTHDNGVVVLDLLKREPVWNEVLRVKVILPEENHNNKSKVIRSGK